MSKVKKVKVTTAVTAKKPEPTKAEKMAAFAKIEPDMMEAMDVVHTIGQIEGEIMGRSQPRTIGELRLKKQKPEISPIMQEVFVEVQKAIKAHTPMRGPHEGYAVMLEELDELWEEIKANRGQQRSARKEAIQVAAMAVRYILDVRPA